MAKRNLWDMAGLDIFLQSLSDLEYQEYSGQVVYRQTLPVQSLWQGLDFYTNETLDYKREDVDRLSLLAGRYNWTTDAIAILNENYDALVLTDVNQNILWTNSGFFKMTGYTNDFAMGKKPSFLQGTETSTEARFSINKFILAAKPFSCEVINYKKNGNKYLCGLQVFPISAEGKITHYLALETEMFGIK